MHAVKSPAGSPVKALKCSTPGIQAGLAGQVLGSRISDTLDLKGSADYQHIMCIYAQALRHITQSVHICGYVVTVMNVSVFLYILCTIMNV